MTLHDALSLSVEMAKAPPPPKPTGRKPYFDRGWWTVDLDNGRCIAFERESEAKRFIRDRA